MALIHTTSSNARVCEHVCVHVCVRVCVSCVLCVVFLCVCVCLSVCLSVSFQGYNYVNVKVETGLGHLGHILPRPTRCDPLYN